MATKVRLIAKQDTFLKQSPEQASQLPSNKLQKLPAGTALVLQAYTGPDSTGQYILNLEDIKFDGIGTNWYVFPGHVEIRQGAISTVQTVSDLLSKQSAKDVVTVQTKGRLLKMVFNVETVIKRKPVDASVLNDDSKQVIPAGTELVLSTLKPDANKNVKFSIQDSHVKFNLKDLEFKGFTIDWYVFIKHVGIQPLG
jgi:hypothetical protein